MCGCNNLLLIFDEYISENNFVNFVIRVVSISLNSIFKKYNSLEFEPRKLEGTEIP